GGASGAPCTLNVGALGGGESAAVAFAVTVDNAVAASVTALENSASIEDDGSNGADGDESDNGDTIITQLDAAPDLVLEKDDGNVTARSGDLLVYTLTLTNHGNQGAVNVVISETVPAYTSFNSVESDADWSCMPDGDAGS